MSEVDVRIRRARREGDLTAAAMIMATTDPWKRLGRTYNDTLSAVNDPAGEVYAAFVEEEVVGFVLIRMNMSLFRGYIQAFAVHENWRNRGIGTMLLEFAEERIFRESANVFLCVSSFNDSAQRLYLRRGYQRIGELKDLIVTGA